MNKNGALAVETNKRGREETCGIVCAGWRGGGGGGGGRLQQQHAADDVDERDARAHEQQKRDHVLNAEPEAQHQREHGRAQPERHQQYAHQLRSVSAALL